MTSALVAALDGDAPAEAATEARRLLRAVDERRAVIAHVTDSVANQAVTVGPATAAQIVLVDQAWRDVVARYGALTSAEYAVMVGGASSSRSIASKARDDKGLLGYRRGRRVLFPGFQFEAGAVRPGWLQVVAPLRAAGWDDEDVIVWLCAPSGRLGRRSPVEALDAGDGAQVAEVVAAAADGVE